MEHLFYNIGFLVGKMISFIFWGFLRFLWKGIVTASKKHSVFIPIYGILLVSAFASFFLDFEKQGSIFILVFFMVVCLACGYTYLEEYPTKKERKFFNKVFLALNFPAPNEQVPYYIGRENLTDYTTEFIFQTLIPLSEWQKYTEKLEMYFNQKIIAITQNETDNRKIHIMIQMQELPTQINWSESYNQFSNLVIGEGACGRCEWNPEKHPHAFICGETGSGKSNIIKCLIHQSLVKKYDVKLIDFKRGVSFSYFSNVIEIYYEYEGARKLLEQMVEETNHRLDLFRENRVDNINAYNRKVNFTGSMKKIIIYIDELAELLKNRDKEIANSLYDSIETLTRISRAVGIHLVMGIQRPDSTVVNGQIKNNVSFRVCGRFVDKEPSRIILGSDAASHLKNIKGRFLVRDNSIQEIQAFYISDDFLNATYKNDMSYRVKNERVKTAVNTPTSEKKEKEDTTTARDERKEKETFEGNKDISFDFSDL